MSVISLVMIVKNEEEILVKCLEHVKGIVDEFIIVDTGSTDGTKEIIKQYGEVYEIPFVDFVTTKNAALELATGDYILWMDADEIIYSGLDALRMHADAGTHDAITSRITEGPEDYAAVAMQYDRIRMFKRGVYKFAGPGVHEILVGEGKSLKDFNVLVRHEHLKKDKSVTGTERFQKYVVLLKDAIAKGNEVNRAWFYLARTYKDLGQSLDAISAYMMYLSLDGGFLGEIWQAHYDVALCYKFGGEYEKSIKWANKALELDPRRSEARCLLGDLAFQMQAYEVASSMYKSAISEVPQDISFFLSPNYYDNYPKDQLVLCQYFLGDNDAAERVCKSLIDAKAGRETRVLNNLWWITRRTKATIFLTLGHTPEPVYGGMMDKIGVGGVETTYLELAEELAKQGKNVFLFCNILEAHIHNGVYFVPWPDLEKYWNLGPDVIITSRWFEPFYVNSQAKKIIWFQDAFFGIPDDKQDLFSKADLVVCSSEWHRSYIQERLGRSLKPEKLKVVPLGIRKSLFNKVVKRDPNKVIYSSNPDRGLEHLIDMWDEITQRIPDIKLTVTYGWEGLKTWSGESAWHDSIKALQTKCNAKMLQHGNITFTGRVTKARLAEEMLSSSVLVYPNNFWETFCLTALEAQAAGLPIITTDIGALSTVVNRNFNTLIDGSPRSEAYQRQFINGLQDLIGNPIKRGNRADDNRRYVAELDCDWLDISNKWVSMVYSLLKE